MSDQVVEPKLTTGFCGLPAVAISMAAGATTGCIDCSTVGIASADQPGWFGAVC
jgi:hypothetical protein